MFQGRVTISHRLYKAVVYLIGGTIICALQLYSVSAASDGTHALDFLNIPVGARAAALGLSNYAGLTGPDLIFANPGLLGSHNAVFMSHQELFLDTRSDAVSATFSLGRRFVIGLGADFFDPGDINGYSSDNEATGNIPAGERLIRMAVARDGPLSYGVSISHFSQRLDSERGSGFGLGAGIGLRSEFAEFAVAVDNIGPNFKIGESSWPLPGRYSISACRAFLDGSLSLSGATDYNAARGWDFSGGIQYSLVRGVSLLGGSRVHDPLNLGMLISAGKFNFYYTYMPLGDYGDRHIFSLTLSY